MQPQTEKQKTKGGGVMIQLPSDGDVITIDNPFDEAFFDDVIAHEMAQSLSVPSYITSHEHLEKILKSVLDGFLGPWSEKKVLTLIVSGDFNICLNRQNQLVSSYQIVMAANNFVLGFCETSRVTQTTLSCLDQFIHQTANSPR